MHFDEPLIDALREHGATDRHLTIIKNLEHVGHLLTTLHQEYDGDCVECGSYVGDRRRAHYRNCKTLEALCALGLDSMKMELERAEHEAREEHARRSAPPRPRRSNAEFMRDFNNAAKEAFGGGRLEEAVYANNPLMAMLRNHGNVPPPQLIVSQRDLETAQALGSMEVGNPGFGGIAVQASPLVREGEALMFRAEDWAQPKPDLSEVGGPGWLTRMERAPQRMMTCPNCQSTSLTPLPNSAMLTCDACGRTSTAERCMS